MLQARITPWVATVVVLPLIVLGAGSQNLLWAFQIGFLGSVALGLGAMLLVNHAGTWQRRDWAGARAGRLRAALVGRHVLLVVVCALVVLLRRGIKPAAAFAIRAGRRLHRLGGRLPASDEPRRAVGARVRRPRVAVRRHGPEHGGRRVRPRRAAARLDRARAARRLPRAHGGAGDDRGCGGVRVRRRGGRPVRALGLRPAEARDRASDRDALRLHRDHAPGTGGRDGRRPAAAPGAARRVARRASWSSSCARRARTRTSSASTRPTRQARELPLRSAILAAAQIANDPTQTLAPDASPRAALLARPDGRRPPPLRSERRVAVAATVARAIS